LLGPPDDQVIEPLRVIGVLAFYLAIFLIIRGAFKRTIEPVERRTFLFIWVGAGIAAFSANYLLYLAGQMSFLPWVNNFIHTFIWIGFVLGWLYLGVREDQPMWFQFLIFAFLSLIVKGCEQILLGTWEKEEVFFGLLEGNGAYVLFWSTFDGLVPIMLLWGLRLASRRIPGLIAT
jgi:hypothetical protein